MSNRLDLLILGATGFTGMHCIPYAHKMAEERKLTWGIAGRNEEKLKEVLDKMGKKMGVDISKVAIVLCDIKDDTSLLKMAKQAKIVINCCGPYRFLGEPVVKACIEAGTHHVDVSGEPQYMENIYLKYNELAKENGVYIISACGLDCIPADLGIIHLQQNFSGTLNSAVSYLQGWIAVDKKNLVGSGAVNYGTWESLIESLAHWGELKELRKLLNLKKLPDFKPKLETSILPQTSKVVDGWVLPFLGADKSVVRRTQRYLYEHEAQRPVQVDTKFVVSNIFYLLLLIILGSLILVMVQFEFTKKILLDYPYIFSLGMFSKKQPSDELIDNTWFQITFYSEGWKEKLTEKDDQFSKQCDTAVISRVKGRNPGYGTTCACIVGSACVIATEADKIPLKGGVLTPGMAFAKTSLIKILQDNEITFDILTIKDL